MKCTADGVDIDVVIAGGEQYVTVQQVRFAKATSSLSRYVAANFAHKWVLSS